MRNVRGCGGGGERENEFRTRDLAKWKKEN